MDALVWALADLCAGNGWANFAEYMKLSQAAQAQTTPA